MKKILTLSIFLVSMTLIPTITQASEPETVHYVDLQRYQGTWYEIARYYTRFQRKCAGTKAIYKIKGHRVKVTNLCQKKKRTDKIKKAKGTALVKDTTTNAKLKVSFVPLLQRWGIFGGDYWILYLDQNYEYAVVGDSKREFLWILSRKPRISKGVYEFLKSKAAEQGYNTNKLLLTPAWKFPNQK